MIDKEDIKIIKDLITDIIKTTNIAFIFFFIFIDI